MADGGVVGMMAVLWMTEAIPIPVTALLPLVLFPLLDVAPFKDAAAPFANPVIYLFLGGFVLALGLQRWRLHERVAFWIVGRTGSRASRVLAGFMVATAFVSMWINNSATTVMMLPMAISVAALFRARMGGDEKGQEGVGLALMLGVAYAASIGGVGTLIGTAPNAFMAGFLRETYGLQIGFGQWMLVGVPLVVVGIFLTHAILARVCLTDRKMELAGLREEVLGSWRSWVVGRAGRSWWRWCFAPLRCCGWCSLGSSRGCRGVRRGDCHDGGSRAVFDSGELAARGVCFVGAGFT